MELSGLYYCWMLTENQVYTKHFFFFFPFKQSCIAIQIKHERGWRCKVLFDNLSHLYIVRYTCLLVKPNSTLILGIHTNKLNCLFEMETKYVVNSCNFNLLLYQMGFTLIFRYMVSKPFRIFFLWMVKYIHTAVFFTQ